MALTRDSLSMPVPLFEGKWRFPSTYRPALFLDHLRSNGWTPGAVPESVICTYARFELYLSTRPDAFTANHMLGTGPGRFFLVNDTDNLVAINCLGIGPSATAAQVELQAELGVRRFVILGTAGAVSPELRSGDVVVPTEAVRADGTSDHYLEPGAPAVPDGDLSDAFAGHLTSTGRTVHRGPTWTTAGAFRTTAEEIEHYAGHGVLTVEEEAAALFAVAAHRSVEAAAGLVVDSTPKGSTWDLDLRTAGSVLQQLLEPTIDFLAGRSRS